MVRVLGVRALTAFEIADLAQVDIAFVRCELGRLEAQGKVRALCDKRFVPQLGIATKLYALDDGEPDEMASPQRGAAHYIKPKPRKRTQSGSGQIAAPCISRSFKWNRGDGIAF